MMIYVYYLSLRYSPSLVKNWFSNSNNQVKDNVEPFTDRYISPMLADLEFKEVEKWLENAEDRPEGLAIKISRKVREITVTYEVDETTMEMMVKLPPSFPLQLVEIKGVRRVAVSEKQWKTWLLACQAVIALQVRNNGFYKKSLKDRIANHAIIYTGRLNRRWPNSLPAQCQTPPRRRGGVCNLLLHSRPGGADTPVQGLWNV